MADIDLDTLLMILENPTRRRILAELAKETHYPLLLSKKLHVSQQAIMKHLKVLEQYDLVESFEEKSTVGGPSRKCYVPTKRYSVRIDMGPNVFDTFIQKYDEGTPQVDEYGELYDKYTRVSGLRETRKKLVELANLISDINLEIKHLEERRAYLLNLRERAVGEAHELISALCDEYDERSILYYVVDEATRSLESISEALNLREKTVQDIFERLAKQRILFDK
jgi:predicted transcriptional regulator